MIRKFVVFTTIIYVILWLLVAHLLKSKIADLISQAQSDNIEISCKNIALEGFPFKWSVVIEHPILTSTTQNEIGEIKSDYIRLVFDYKLKNTNMNFGKNIYLKDKNSEYKFSSQDNIFVQASFTETLYRPLLARDFNLSELLQSVMLKTSNIIGLKAGQEIADFSNIKALLLKSSENNIDNFSIKISGDYKNLNSISKIDNANMLLNLNYALNNSVADVDNKFDFDRMFDVSQIYLKIDGAMLDAKGIVKFSRQSMPKGKLLVAMNKYGEIIDILVPENFIISKNYINKVIAKAADSEALDNKANINLKIEFSENGLSVGKLSLLEIKTE